MKRSVFGGVCLVIGSVVGAGFATGRELYLYFYNKSIVAVALCCFVFFTLCIASVCNNKGGYLLGAGKLVKAYDACMLLCYFVVMSTMLAAANNLLSVIFNVNPHYTVFGVLCACICGVTLYFDLNGLKLVNIIAVPLIALFIILLAVSAAANCSSMPAEVGVQTPILGAGYVGLNVLLMCGVLTDIGKQYTKKQITKIAVISSLVLSVLMVLILVLINCLEGEMSEMPLVTLSKQQSPFIYALGTVAILLAIVTTLQCSAYPLVKWQQRLCKDKLVGIVVVIVSALLLSYVGFANIVNAAYPLMSVLGLALMVIITYDNLTAEQKSKNSATCLQQPFCVSQLPYLPKQQG